MRASEKLHIRHQKAHPTQHGRHDHIRCLDARNHYPQIKHHTPPPKRGDNQSIPIPGFPHGTKR